MGRENGNWEHYSVIAGWVSRVHLPRTVSLFVGQEAGSREEGQSARARNCSTTLSVGSRVPLAPRDRSCVYVWWEAAHTVWWEAAAQCSLLRPACDCCPGSCSRLLSPFHYGTVHVHP